MTLDQDETGADAVKRIECRDDDCGRSWAIEDILDEMSAYQSRELHEDSRHGMLFGQKRPITDGSGEDTVVGRLVGTYEYRGDGEWFRIKEPSWPEADFDIFADSLHYSEVPEEVRRRAYERFDGDPVYIEPRDDPDEQLVADGGSQTDVLNEECRYCGESLDANGERHFKTVSERFAHKQCVADDCFDDRERVATTEGVTRIEHVEVIKTFGGKEEILESYWVADCPRCYRTHESEGHSEDDRRELLDEVLECCGAEWIPPSGWVEDCDVCGDDHRGEHNCNPLALRQPFPAPEEHEYECAECDWSGSEAEDFEDIDGHCPDCGSAAVRALKVSTDGDQDTDVVYRENRFGVEKKHVRVDIGTGVVEAPARQRNPITERSHDLTNLSDDGYLKPFLALTSKVRSTDLIDIGSAPFLTFDKDRWEMHEQDGQYVLKKREAETRFEEIALEENDG